MIELALQKKEYSKPLLKAIASNTGNLYHHENRAKVWSLLDSDTRFISLDKTCPDIIGDFKPEDWSGFEVEIKQHIMQPEFIKKEIICNKKIGIRTKITIMETIGKMTGESLIDIVNASNNTINHLEAETLTNIINKYSLRNVLEYFYGNRGRYHLYPEVVDGCKHLLSGWERLWLKSSVNPVSIQSIYNEIDRQNLHYVFGVLRDLGFNDHHINRLQNEYVAGVKGIELQDLCNRLKSYIHSHS